MANGKRAGLVKAADLVGAADGPGRSSQKGSVDCGRGGSRRPQVGFRLWFVKYGGDKEGQH